MSRFPKNRVRQQLQAETRRKEVVRYIADGVTLKDAAKELGVSYITAKRDKAAVMDQMRKETKTEAQAWRDQHIAELNKLRDQLQDFLIPPEKRIELALRIIAQDAKLKGTEAPSRSVSTNVNVELTNVDSLYARFVRTVARKLRKPESWQKFWDACEALPVDPIEEPRFLKALPENTDE